MSSLPVPTRLSRPKANEQGASAICAEVLSACPRCAYLEVELNKLKSERAYWQSMHSKAVERGHKLEAENKELKAKLKLREDQLFRRKSEKGAAKKRPEGAQKAAQEDKRKPGKQPGSPGYGRRVHEELPVREEWRDLSEQDKCCPECQQPFAPIHGSEDSEYVEVEVRGYRRRIRRKRYRPTCQCGAVPGIIIAPQVPKLIPQGAYGISFWVRVLLDKFLLQRPTNRLLLEWKLELGLEVSPGTVAGGLARFGVLFEPLMDEIVERNLSEGRWHADETRWMVLAEVEGKNSSRWWLWVFASETTVVFYIEPTRSSRVPKEHFGEEAEGILTVDRYSAYKALLGSGRVMLAYCWAHVRRDFLGVGRRWPEQESWALLWVKRIGELYRLNDQRLLLEEQPWEYAEADTRLREAVRRMALQRDEELGSKELPRPACKALESLQKHWGGLTVFVEHPQVPMDNNYAERLVRNPVVGRKNYYGSHSLWSACLAAMLFSVFQTLVRWGINPKLWLTAYLEACAASGGQAPENVERFIPWKMTEQELSAYRSYEPPRFDTS